MSTRGKWLCGMLVGLILAAAVIGFCGHGAVQEGDDETGMAAFDAGQPTHPVVYVMPDTPDARAQARHVPLGPNKAPGK